MPQAFLNSPVVPAEFLSYLEAFWTLNRSRQIGFESVGYIPLTEIEAFCRLFEVADVPMFVQVLQHLDGIFVAFHNEKIKAERKRK